VTSLASDDVDRRVGLRVGKRCWSTPCRARQADQDCPLGDSWEEQQAAAVPPVSASVCEHRAVISGATYVHTNLIARDWRELVRFYVEVFGCEPVPPQRNAEGPWLDSATGLNEARLQGMHLLLPGGGPDGPTLEIYSYDDMEVRPPSMPNDTGYGHLAFSVNDISTAVQDVVDHGGTLLGQIATTTVTGVGDLEVIYVRDPEGNIIELQTWRTGPP